MPHIFCKLNRQILYLAVFFVAPNPVSKAIFSRYRLYLLRPTGLQEDIGSIGAKFDVFFFR
jgi:hypothetical protein